MRTFAIGLVIVCGCSDGVETVDVPNPPTDPASGPAAGNPDGNCEVPAEAGLASVTHVRPAVGDGTAASCTGDAVIGRASCRERVFVGV